MEASGSGFQFYSLTPKARTATPTCHWRLTLIRLFIERARGREVGRLVQQALDGCEQLRAIERLHDEIVASGGQRLIAIYGHRMGGQRNDRRWVQLGREGFMRRSDNPVLLATGS